MREDLIHNDEWQGPKTASNQSATFEQLDYRVTILTHEVHIYTQTNTYFATHPIYVSGRNPTL